MIVSFCIKTIPSTLYLLSTLIIYLGTYHVNIFLIYFTAEFWAYLILIAYNRRKNKIYIFYKIGVEIFLNKVYTNFERW